MELSKITSLLETPQQFLLGDRIDHETEYRLGRACVAHCIAAIDQLRNISDGRPEELIAFVLEFGAGSGSGLYVDGKGWLIVGIADLMRFNGFNVVAQNLALAAEVANFDMAVESGRARNDFEKSRLNMFRAYGGVERSRWSNPIESTLIQGGYVISTIEIPLLSGLGFGGHTVVITEMDADNNEVTYFDPDHYNVQRYGITPPEVKRVHEKHLLYSRPLTDHLDVMTGEVLHVFPPSNA